MDVVVYIHSPFFSPNIPEIKSRYPQQAGKSEQKKKLLPEGMSWAEVSVVLKDKENDDLLQCGEGGLTWFWPGRDGFPAEMD